MKKHIIIFFPFLIHLQSYCQDFFTAKVPCSDSLLMTIKGSYKKIDDYINSSISTVLPKAQQPETFRRMDAMHQLLLEAYPQPIGMDGRWWHILETSFFAPDATGLKGTSVCSYYYKCVFGSNCCYQDRPMDVSIYADVYNVLSIIANELGEAENYLHKVTMSINGGKVFLLTPIIGSWKGYDLYSDEAAKFSWVLLSRKGESPFIPVTRKQYLDYSINYLDHFYDEQIKFAKQMPVRSLEVQEAEKKQSLDKIEEDYKNNTYQRDAIRKNFLDTYKTEQQRRYETVNNLIKMKEDGIKRYEAALEKSKADKLLDTPAEVFQPFSVEENIPVFASGVEGGKMLITENPAYFRKDLPKYIPQFMVLYWEWVSDAPMYGGEQGAYYRKMIEQNFPIEKLQAMIDK